MWIWGFFKPPKCVLGNLEISKTEDLRKMVISLSGHIYMKTSLKGFIIS